MLSTIVCNGCAERLTEASTAMRRHETLMHTAFERAKAGSLTEEQRKDFKDRLTATLNDAQLRWDAYRLHLIEHGLLPALPSTRDVA